MNRDKLLNQLRHHALAIVDLLIAAIETGTKRPTVIHAADTIQPTPTTFAIPDKIAFTLKEFAAMMGRSPAWAHRQKYLGRLRVTQGLGVDLISREEIERIVRGDNGTTTPKRHNRKGRPLKNPL